MIGQMLGPYRVLEKPGDGPSTDVAYGSDESGRWEVYVQPYPGSGRRTQLSTDGGAHPAWRADERALFYVTLRSSTQRGRMMEVDFRPGSSAGIGTPRQLFEFDPQGLIFGAWHVRPCDVAPDGQRFYVLQQHAEARLRPAPITHINLGLNWFEELKTKVPTGR